MLTFNATEEKSCAKLMGTQPTSNNTKTSLISDNTSLLTSTNDSNCLDTCSFYSGPSDATILSFAESCETSSSIAYSGSETSGSIAFAGSGESCGSIASVSVSSGSSSFSGSGCSYSC